MRAYQNEVLKPTPSGEGQKKWKLSQALYKTKPPQWKALNTNEAIKFLHPSHASTQVQMLSFALFISPCIFTLHPKKGVWEVGGVPCPSSVVLNSSRAGQNHRNFGFRQCLLLFLILPIRTQLYMHLHTSTEIHKHTCMSTHFRFWPQKPPAPTEQVHDGC